VGVHLDIEEPQHPDLVIENNENLEDVSVIAKEVINFLRSRTTEPKG